MRPPYVVLANHVNFWDPFLVGMLFDRQLHYIAADGNFRSRAMRLLMTVLGAVPKAKARNDVDTIHALRDLVARKQAVALFPEGQRTWDGAPRELIPGTEKLLRILGVPVIRVALKGGYLSKPRWARRFRRGRVEIDLQLLYTARDLAVTPKHVLAAGITESLRFDEDAWQSETGRLFIGPDRAEGAEKLLFLCPDCGGWDTFRSRGNVVTCDECGHSAWFAPSGTLYRLAEAYPTLTGLHRFPRVSRWNAYQRRQLQNAIRTGGPPPCVTDRAVLFTGFRSRPLYRHGTVRVTLEDETLRIEHEGEIEIPLKTIRGTNVQYSFQLEFYAGGRLYVLRITPPGPSAYRFEQTILYCQAGN